MDAQRRWMMTAGLGAGAAVATSSVVDAGPRQPPPLSTDPSPIDLTADSPKDQSKVLQQAIDAHALAGQPLHLPPGTFQVRNVQLRPGSAVMGAARGTTLSLIDGGALLSADGSRNCSLDGITFDGRGLGVSGEDDAALLHFSKCTAIAITNCHVLNTNGDGVHFRQCTGRIQDCTFTAIRRAALRSTDAGGLIIAHNDITDCGDNGILIWRTQEGEDGTIVTANRIRNIRAQSGGSGQNGNGINVFRASNVSVTNNRISDCAYSAVRGNAASNFQVTSNSCSRLGEVAIYAEFGFEGAQISNNLIEAAATGISVTNFDQGGRLAVVTGNLIRDLHRREFEPVDKRGEGIGVEADTLVANNVIENAATCGLRIGWGTYRRDVLATQNMIRNAKIGIVISGDPATGQCLVSANLISNAHAGAIRLDYHGRLGKEDLSVTSETSKPGLTVSHNIVS
jgi:uncharacterized secreted repeat protein (TIGR03808 family)